MESNDLKVFFVVNKKEEKIPTPGQILISPLYDEENNISNNIKCSYKVCMPDGEQRHEGKIYLGFLSPNDFFLGHLDEDIRGGNLETSEQKEVYEKINQSLLRYLEYSGEEFLPSTELPFFFTMQQTMQEYRYLSENLQPKSLTHFLDKMHDVINAKPSGTRWYEYALESEVFQFGFMRNSESFYTFHNADSILNGVELDSEGGLSSNLKLNFKLDKYSIPHEVNFRFDSKSIIPKRISVLIGKNGLGKSETLKAFCRGALHYKDKYLELVDYQGNRPKINRVIAIATPGETNNTFPRELIKSQKVYYRKLALTRNGTKSIASALVRLARGDERGEERIGRKTRWDLLEASLKKALPFDDVYVKLKNDTFFPLRDLQQPGSSQDSLQIWGGMKEGVDPVIKAGDGFYPLSSGQLTFLKFAIMCCLHIENGSFVLMDEPETHMHPNMISNFIALIDELLEMTGSYAILSSHSAYFVREVTRAQVHIFKELDDRILISNPRLRTFGADVDSISDFVFEEDIENTLTDKIFEKVKGRSFDSVEAELGGELSYAALMELRSRLGD